MPDFYSLTWSLAVEEWFYLLFPLAMFFLIGLGARARQAARWTIIAFLLIPLALRVTMFDHQGIFNNLDPRIRHVVIFRLDAIGCGVAVAYLSKWHLAIYARLVRYWWVFALMALACMAYIKWEYFCLVQGKLSIGLYFTCSAVAFAGLIPAIAVIRPTRSVSLNGIITYTSLCSYSLYLGHIVAFTETINFLRKVSLFDFVYPNPWLVYPLFLVAAYALATLTYYFIEKPLLLLRDLPPRLAHAGQ